MLQTAHLFLNISHSHFPPLLSLLRGEGGPGVRESRHLPARSSSVRRSQGPGVFFVIPCVDVYEKVDLRTNTYEIPPQEVRKSRITKLQCNSTINIFLGFKEIILNGRIILANET